MRALVESRQLALINPPVAFLLENKAVQAAIWNFFETGLYFDERERRVIATYMLPTYLDPPGEGAYVIKPVHGAEGDSIILVETPGNRFAGAQTARIQTPRSSIRSMLNCRMKSS